MSKLYLLAAIGAAVSILCACGANLSASNANSANNNANSASITETADNASNGASVTETTEGANIAEEDESAATDLEVYGFQAGKADAFLITTANSTVLIDAGEKGFGREILSYLEEIGVEKLDYMIISHFDQDHVGGCARILNNFQVDHVLQNNRSKDSEEYEKYIKALKNAGLEPVTVQESMEFVLDGVSWTVDPPRRNHYSDDDSNNASLIVKITNGENNLLFMGDAKTERIKEFLDWNQENYDLIKIPHHGKEESLIGDLLDNVKPKYAIITSSDDELESEEIVNALETAGTEVYLTRIAPIRFYCDGNYADIAYENLDAAA